MLQNELLEIQAEIDALKETMIAKRSDAFIQFVNRKRGLKHSSKSVKNMIAGKSKLAKPINCYDLQGQLIATYNSVSEACRVMNIGVNTSYLYHGLKVGGKSRGHYWRYAPYKNNIADEIASKVDGRSLYSKNGGKTNRIKLDDIQMTDIINQYTEKYNTTKHSKIRKLLRENGYAVSADRVRNIVNQIKNK